MPAESAELGITDKILTKINTQETVSKVDLLNVVFRKGETDANLDPKYLYERFAANFSLLETGHWPKPSSD